MFTQSKIPVLLSISDKQKIPKCMEDSSYAINQINPTDNFTIISATEYTYSFQVHIKPLL